MPTRGNSQNDEKLAYYAFSLANACAVARNTRRNFAYKWWTCSNSIGVRLPEVVPSLLFDFQKRRRAKRKVTY